MPGEEREVCQAERTVWIMVLELEGEMCIKELSVAGA